MTRPSVATLRWVSRAALVATGLLTLTACGGGNVDTPANDSVVKQHAWRLTAPPEGTTLNIVVAVGSSTCDSFKRIDVAETSKVVRVRALITHLRAGPGEACTDDLVTRRVSVELKGSLGARDLEGCAPPPSKYPVFEPVPAEGCEAVIQQSPTSEGTNSSGSAEARGYVWDNVAYTNQ